jgi:hypothetical protein
VRAQDHVQQGRDGGIWAGVAHLSATGWAGEPGRGTGATRTLRGEPFFHAGSTERVEAVEESEGLIEELGTNLGQRALET